MRLLPVSEVCFEVICDLCRAKPDHDAAGVVIRLTSCLRAPHARRSSADPVE